MLVMSVVLLGTWVLLPRVRGIPIRASATRAAAVLTFHVGACVMGNSFTVATAGRYPLMSAFIPVIAGLATAILCATCLTRASDYCPEFEPISEDEFDRFMSNHEARWSRFADLPESGSSKHSNRSA